jgi:selenocysteine lyase/cysteine desulfurase
MSPSPTRRGFLCEAATVAVFLPAACASLRELSRVLAEEPASGEDYWSKVRDQFPFQEARVPMNAANLCPSPRCVSERVAQLTADVDVDCSFQNREKLARMLEASRAKVAEQLGVTADEVALVRNTSEGNNVVNNGLKLRSGDEVIVWDQNHPTNQVAWDVRAARFGLVVKRVSTPQEPRGVEELVDCFKGAMTPRSRVLAITHVSNVSGLRLPVRELCDAAHQRSMHVHVDGAQTWGALDVNLRELGCDTYTASAHKWFVGPREVGLLFVKSERIPEIWPNVVAPGWGNRVEPDVRGARRFESLGQRDDAALAAIEDAVDFHKLIGSTRIERRVHELAGTLKSELKMAGLKLITPLEPQFSAGVCIVDVPAAARTAVFERMYSEFGIAGAATGGFRLCPHVYNTAAHVDRAVRGLRSLRDLIG